ncbi:MAG: carboxypeptidase-like regulatory domain-containing protein, partial [Bacteroidota bacterium]
MNRIRGHIVLLLLLLVWTQVNAQQSLLEKKISIEFRNESVGEALDRLMDEANCTINFRSADIPANRKISKAYVATALGKIIRDLWGDHQIILRATSTDITVKVERKKGKGNLQGYLKDDNNEPLPFATVAIKGTSRGSVTDESGYFEIKEIIEGGHTLVASSTGYLSKKQAITIRPNETVTENIILSTDVKRLDEVIVEGRSEKVEELVQSAQAITVVETRIAKVQTADLGEVVARTQGVNIQRSGGLGSGSQFSLNGLTNDQIRMFLNGIPMDAMGYINGLANVPVNLIERVEIYRGVVPIRFG